MKSGPIKRHGGKAYQAKKIISLMPAHTRYIEPYFGGGAVLLARDGVGVAEFVNDIDFELTNFWRILGNVERFPIFARMAQTIPFSQREFEDAKTPIVIDGDDLRTEMNAAIAFFIRNRQSRQALGKCFATPTRRLRQGMNEQVSAWLSAVDGLPAFHARMRRVEIRCMEAIDFIHELDSPESLAYVDPPYLHETRTATKCYKHEMTTEQHELLIDCLYGMKGKFILSGYPNDLYDDAAQEFGWNRIDIEIDNKSSSAKSKEKKIERLWANFNLPV